MQFYRKYVDRIGNFKGEKAMKKMTDLELQNITGGSILGLVSFVGNTIRRPRIYLPGEPVKPKVAIM